MPWADLLAQWNALAAESPNMVAAREWNPQRKKHARARFGEQDPAEAWAEMLAEVKRSTFLRQGANGDRVWRFKFDWALLPTNWTKIMEGSYRDAMAEEPAQRPFVPVVVSLPPEPELSPEEEAARKEQVIQKWAEFRRRLGQTAVAGR